MVSSYMKQELNWHKANEDGEYTGRLRRTYITYMMHWRWPTLYFVNVTRSLNWQQGTFDVKKQLGATYINTAYIYIVSLYIAFKWKSYSLWKWAVINWLVLILYMFIFCNSFICQSLLKVFLKFKVYLHFYKWYLNTWYFKQQIYVIF